MKIKAIPTTERPREKALNHGIQALSNAEILAIILRSGIKEYSVLELGYRLIEKFNDLNGLTKATLYELIEVPGINKVKALEIMAGVELAKRINEIPSTRIKIKTPHDVYRLLGYKLKKEESEHFYVIFLDIKCHLISYNMITKGSLNSTIIRPRDIFKEAFRSNAASIICVHNHPSGDPTPSESDIETTHAIATAAKTIGIPVVDHIILGYDCFYSFKEGELL